MLDRARVLSGRREAEARGLGTGSWEAGGRRDRMFNHWAAGLRSGFVPQDSQDCDVATLKNVQTNTKLLRSLREGFDFWVQGVVFFKGFR